MGSRIANKLIPIPVGVEMTLTDEFVSAKGKLGESKLVLPKGVRVIQEASSLKVQADDDLFALAGTINANLTNVVKGVSVGFSCELTLVGVGYRATVKGTELHLTLGFSHPVVLSVPVGLQLAVPSQTEIVVSGIDKQAVNQFAAVIRDLRPPEPYKGKGVRYKNEHVKLKEVKKK